MKLNIRRKIFFALFFSLCCVVLIGYLQSKKIQSIIVEELGGNFAKNHILWQTERLKGAIERELSLSTAMASSESIQQWALKESNVRARRRGLMELESFRSLLRSKSWFAVFDATKHYYYNEGNTDSLASVPLKTLVEGQSKDAWYFVTLRGDKTFTLNVDFDEEVGKTNLWINIVMQRDGKPIGILGTGLDITAFINDFVSSKQKGVQSFMLFEDGSIFVSRDPKRMNMRILAKDSPERIKIYSLVSQESQARLQQAIRSVSNNPKRIEIFRTTLDGKPNIVAVSYIPSIRRVVMSAIDETAVFEAKDILFSIIAMVIAAIFVLVLFSLLIDRLVIRPVKELTHGADRLRNGEYSTRFAVSQFDEIGLLKQTFNTMAGEIQSNVQLLEKRVNERTEELAQSRDKISTLLNSSGEGFLKFNKNRFIDDEYSSACTAIFGEKIEGLLIDELLFAESRQQKETFIKIIQGITTQTQPFLKEIMLDLLPKEVELEERHYSMRFLLGARNDFILIMKDITEQIALSRMVEDNERCLSFVVDYIKDENTTQELISEFKRFCATVSQKRQNEIYHQLHTFKGNFLQKGFIKLPLVIHREEGKLQDTIHTEMIPAAVNTKALVTGLDDDISILRTYLGDEFLDEKGVKVSFDRLAAIAKVAGKTDKDLQKSILALFKTPLKKHLQQFGKTVDRIAAEQDKEVRYHLECPDTLYIFYQDYSGIISSMYHLITNAVAHGIELPDIRLRKGKSETGTVSVAVDRKRNNIAIVVSDDGKGIDLTSLSGNASDQGTVQVLFEDGVTSSASVNLTSGRGAGMGSVKSEVESVGGTITISSTEDSGTTVSISIPEKE